MSQTHPIEDWIIYNKGTTPMPPVLHVNKVRMPEQVFTCRRCGKHNTFWTYLCEPCDAKVAFEDGTMDSDDRLI